MTYPLSITTGLVDIVVAASQLSALLTKFIESVSKAPQQARIYHSRN